MRSMFARFFPTDNCATPINAAISEYINKASTTRYKKGGFVFFPGRSSVGQTFTIMIPLHISGMVQIEELVLDVDHYYHISKECEMEVSENAKMVALMLSDFE